jgi:hypothetical protein
MEKGIRVEITIDIVKFEALWEDLCIPRETGQCV